MPDSHGRELLDHARRPATGLANFSKVPFRFVSARGQELGDASLAVVITQLVLDEWWSKVFLDVYNVRNNDSYRY